MTFHLALHFHFPQPCQCGSMGQVLGMVLDTHQAGELGNLCVLTLSVSIFYFSTGLGSPCRLCGPTLCLDVVSFSCVREHQSASEMATILPISGLQLGTAFCGGWLAVSWVVCDVIAPKGAETMLSMMQQCLWARVVPATVYSLPPAPLCPVNTDMLSVLHLELVEYYNVSLQKCMGQHMGLGNSLSCVVAGVSV